VEPFVSLCRSYPGPDIYPPAAFRVEWGPIFHRGRLDGTARVLVIGQDPAAHENAARRILVGEAGQRVQGFLARLGIETSYVMINAFLYSVFGGSGGTHASDPGIVAYRNAWLDALIVGQGIEAVVALGVRADDAWQTWKATPAGMAVTVAYKKITHPTFPESSSHTAAELAEATKQMLINWNVGLTALAPAIMHPDVARPLIPYGEALTPADLAPIPEGDLPAGIPAWMRSLDQWAIRDGRWEIDLTVPPAFQIS
jgi:hypothetical protein